MLVLHVLVTSTALQGVAVSPRVYMLLVLLLCYYHTLVLCISTEDCEDTEVCKQTVAGGATTCQPDSACGEDCDAGEFCDAANACHNGINFTLSLIY